MALEEQFKLMAYGSMRGNSKMGNCMAMLDPLIALVNIINTNVKTGKKSELLNDRINMYN